MYSIEKLRKEIEERLAKKEYEENPIALFEPMTYALKVGGKRLRPVMMLLSAQLYGADVEYVMNPALGIEIFHNFTLLHDDVMDKADLRRGNPTVHKKWNENVAILSGDAMSIKAYQYIVNCRDAHVRQVLQVFNETALEVCKGQQLDMEFETRVDVTLSEYIQMICYKTAVLFAGSLKLGAILGDAPLKDQELLYEFGINLGLAFQIQDDYLDVYGDSSVFGKNIGGDILTRKKTYLLLKAIEKASEEQKTLLYSVLGNETLSDSKKILDVTTLYNHLGIKEETNATIDKYIAQCQQNLAALSIPKDRKAELFSLISKLEHRNV